MRFALLGDHLDAIDMAAALVESRRHHLHVFAGSPLGQEALRSKGLAVPTLAGDLEEILADPVIELVIVGSAPAVRPTHLRRALQSERHVLCVFPPDDSPDIAYEAAMIQKDTGKVLLPLLTACLHPAILALAALIRNKDGELGELRLIEMNCRVASKPEDDDDRKVSFEGWDMLRRLKGEIAELSAVAPEEELRPGDTILVGGKFDNAGLFQCTFLSGPGEPHLRLSATGSSGRADLVFPRYREGPAHLEWEDSTGRIQEQRWESWNAWPVLVEILEAAVAKVGTPPRIGQSNRSDTPNADGVAKAGVASLTWQDAVRSLELDDAARRSLKRRRASTLEYQEATEEAGFKGTMTLVGCGLLWVVVALVILSRWVPVLGWLIIPLLAGFLGMQLLRWVVARPPSDKS